MSLRPELKCGPRKGGSVSRTTEVQLRAGIFAWRRWWWLVAAEDVGRKERCRSWSFELEGAEYNEGEGGVREQGREDKCERMRARVTARVTASARARARG